MNLRRIILAVALLGSGWLAFSGDPQPVAIDTPPAARKENSSAPVALRSPAASAGNGNQAAATTRHEQVVLPLQPRNNLAREPAAGASGLFASKSWTPPPPVQPKVQTAPVAPPLPFTYIGKKLEDGRWEVYLARGEQTHIVRDGSIVDATYRVEAISPPSLRIVYLPLNQTQSLTIEGYQ